MVTDGAERGAGGSLADKRKGSPGTSAGGASLGSSLAGSGSARPGAAGSAAGGASAGTTSLRPAQAASPGARAVAGATAAASSAVGSVLPPPVADSPSAAASLDILAERYASLADDSTFSADEAVDRQIAGLEAWCRAAIWRERREASRFWVLRSTAFVGITVASAAPFLPGSTPALPLIAGTLAVVALAIDTAWPPSADRGARHRAIRELRELQHTLRLRWDKVRLAHPERFSPKRIAHALALLDAAQVKREEIGGYLTDSSPGVSS